MLQNVKIYFPLLGTSAPVYFDTAATSQICGESLKAMDEYYNKYRANVHRGFYDMAEKATAEYEEARASVAEFINADKDEIIFTSGTTFGLNALAYSLCPRLTHRDNIVLSRLEHHANLVPWQQMAKHYGFEIRFIELNKNFNFDLESAKKLIDKNTKIVSFAFVSNVLGCVTPAEQIIKFAKTLGSLTIIDAAQAAAHMPIDVKKLDCDFLVFSGHKIYGPNGIGVLFGKKQQLEENLEPLFFGGEMVSEVTYENAKWNKIPHRFEAGTPNIPAAIGLGAAVKFIKKIGWEKIQNHERELTIYAIEKLKNKVNIFGSQDIENRTGVVSFTIKGIHPHDLSDIFNRNGIALRGGYHCAEPLHREYSLPGTARISIGVYNTKEEIDKLISAIQEAKQIFKIK